MDNLKNLINDLAKIVIDALIIKRIDIEEAQEISQFILEEKRKITSADQISDFLEKVNRKYSFLFSDYFENYKKQKNIQIDDQKKIEEIKNRLLKFN